MPNKKILLCDDDQKIAQILEGFFLAKGYDMAISLTGEDALNKAQQDKPDLVIMDLKLPGMNGVEVSKKIKESLPSTKVMILSGFSDDYAQELKSIRVESILQKPVNMKELTETIADILAGRRIDAKEDLKGTPNAKLLIAEHHHSTATAFREYFSNYENCGGEYEIDMAWNKNIFMNKLSSFKPNVILLSINFDGSPGAASKIAGYIVDNFEDKICCLAVSNELDIRQIGTKVKEVSLEKGLIKK